MCLTWMNNGFICKDLYAPFVLEKDSEYLDDLKKKYKILSECRDRIYRLDIRICHFLFESSGYQ